MIPVQVPQESFSWPSGMEGEEEEEPSQDLEEEPSPDLMEEEQELGQGQQVVQPEGGWFVHKILDSINDNQPIARSRIGGLGWRASNTRRVVRLRHCRLTHILSNRVLLIGWRALVLDLLAICCSLLIGG
jgi:hypothetical protein